MTQQLRRSFFTWKNNTSSHGVHHFPTKPLQHHIAINGRNIL
jgi:hypothetical protein